MAALRAHPPNPVAPWAEVAPDVPYPMTVDELHALPDDGWAYELLNGVLVRMPLSSGGASNVGSRLLIRLVPSDGNGSAEKTLDLRAAHGGTGHRICGMFSGERY